MSMHFEKIEIESKGSFLDSLPPWVIIVTLTPICVVFLFFAENRFDNIQQISWQNFKTDHAACSIVKERYVGSKTFPQEAVLDCYGKEVSWTPASFL